MVSLLVGGASLAWKQPCDTDSVMRLTALFLFGVCGLSAQTAQPEARGLTPEWEVRDQLAALAADVKTLDPLLKQANPSQWIEKGAPQAYIGQWQSAQTSIQSLIMATSQLAQHPEKLPLALDAFFQMERVEMLLKSFREGVRRYQSTSLADQLSYAIDSNNRHRDRLRQLIRDLANEREQEFNTAHQEAQRCRAILTRQTSPEPKSGKNPGQQSRRN